MDTVITAALQKYLTSLGISDLVFSLDFPKDIAHGDYMTNLALVLNKQVGKNPKEIAEEIVTFLENENINGLEKIEVAGPGFINFILSSKQTQEEVFDILKKGDTYGETNLHQGETLLIEHSCPNPFKQFHIGHLMSNTIGESLGRLYASQGYNVIADSYGGDVGLHVAKAIWAIDQFKIDFPHDVDDLSDKTRFLGNAYAYGSTQYEEDEEVKKKIDLLNKQILEYLSGKPEVYDEDLAVYFTKGKEWSLEHFLKIYDILGSDLQYHLFESEVTDKAQEILEEGLKKGIFEESNGAVIYSEERSGLHTRVFQNSHGVPTYEAKDLGHAARKDELIDSYDQSIIITAEEQTEYFKVVLKAMSETNPEIAAKTSHIAHGMMKLPTGKMSSRTGDIITGESLLFDLIAEVETKMSDRDIPSNEKKEIARKIAVAALKYSILRSAPGSDIIFEKEKSLAMDGDSGPYLQYTFTRAKSLIEKSEGNFERLILDTIPEEGRDLARLLGRFEAIVKKSYDLNGVHGITTYITEVAHKFNAFYAKTQIIGSEQESWFVDLTEATAQVIKNGLHILGIEVPDKM